MHHSIKLFQEFRLLHYAGEVTYKINGFLDKNNDLLFRDLREAMTQSNKKILQVNYYHIYGMNGYCGEKMANQLLILII